MTKYGKEETIEAEKRLRELLPEKDRLIYTTIKKVSQSGMYRHISCTIIKDNKPYCIDWAVSRLLELPLKNDSVSISGCGMDMGFSIVYNLGSILFPKGDGKTITGRNGNTKPETDGGYLIKQRWL